MASSKDKQAADLRSAAQAAVETHLRSYSADPGKTNPEGTANTTDSPTIEATADKILRIIESSFLPFDNRVRTETLYKSSLVVILSYFDYLLAHIIRYYYARYPESLPENLSLSLSELRTCQDYDDVMQMIINKKVDSILFGSLLAQRSHLKNDFKIDLYEDIIDWPSIGEAIERRNLIVHNNGLVNSRYLKNVRNILMTSDTPFQEGESITVSEEYFTATYNEIWFAGIVLLQTCWRKWADDTLETANLKLDIAANVLAISRKDSLMERLNAFSKRINVQDSEVLNTDYCLSLKRQGKTQELGAELEKLLPSKSERMLAAISILKDDQPAIIEHFTRAASSGSIISFDLAVDPILLYTTTIPGLYEKLKHIVNNYRNTKKT